MGILTSHLISNEHITMTNHTQEKFIGVVGVDSGQLMICDPCYMDSEWQEREFLDIRRYEDADRVVYEYPKDFANYSETLPSGKTPNQHLADGEWTSVPVPAKEYLKGEFSYGGVCETTLQEPRAGQLYFRLGHEGAGVAFQSGFGDGVYNVYATYVEERIVSVRIDLG